MPQPAQKLVSYADIEALPDHLTGQILDGELFVSPRPAMPHAFTASALSYCIGPAFHRAGTWRVVAEPELYLRDSVLVPDLAGWRIERWPDVIESNGMEIAPDWVCEVLSPSTERFDRSRKMAAYARFGVQRLWLVHPVNHTVEVYELAGGAWVVRAVVGGNEALCATPFEALEIPLRELWLNPPDDEPEADSTAE